MEVASEASLGPPSWVRLSRSKQHEKVVRSAKGFGLDAVLSEAEPDELWLLAESARLVGDGKLATRVLVAFRERAKDARRTQLAAFLLGRVALEQTKNPAKAAVWFGTYLKEAPDGPLAEQAAGRKIKALVMAGAEEEAKQAARGYLERYPDGLYALQATEVLVP